MDNDGDLCKASIRIDVFNYLFSVIYLLCFFFITGTLLIEPIMAKSARSLKNLQR